jgi:asparagine synthase (glutamine-hydrolysing)
MCGILLNIGHEERAALERAVDIIAHRGPDDRGAEYFDSPGGPVCMGHRRLSILDLSPRGRQPMNYAGGAFWVVFNGEIYNYIEIKEELQRAGRSFETSCDTEVLLAAYAEWGAACLDHFNGMFAFCLYDKERQKIFMARDRMGVKPLCYRNAPDNFTAVSEIKQLTCLAQFKRKVNRNKLYHFISTGDFCYDSGTMWEDVTELDPGCLMEIDLKTWKPGDRLTQTRWYTPPFGPENELDISFEDAVAEFKKRLEKSVVFRMRSDVPVGFLLSGGLDSSTLVAMAHSVPGAGNTMLKTYSSCYDDPKIDERKFIKAVLDSTGVESCLHHPRPEDVRDNLDKIIWHNDLPVLHGSPCPHWLLYQRIKEENDSRKVIIEGQGGDEILCGYGDFHWARLFELLKARSFKELADEYQRFQKIHHEPLKIVARKFFRMLLPFMTPRPAHPALNAGFLLGERTPPPPQAVRREEPDVRRLHKDRLTIIRYILHNVDRSSMAHSRETRTPFLDFNLVEFCLRLPSEHKIKAGVTKRVLREAAADILPEMIRTRSDKQGYSSPVARWVSNDLRKMFINDLTTAADMPFMRADTLRAMIRDFSDSRAPFDPALWRAAVSGRWIRIFNMGL